MSPTFEIIRRPVQVPAVTPRQSNLAFTSVQLIGMNPSQRAQALSCLGQASDVGRRGRRSGGKR